LSYGEVDYFTANLSVDEQKYACNESDYYGMMKGPSYGTSLDGLNFNVPLFQKHGMWTLVIEQDPNTVKTSPMPVKGGPWTFHFVVP
jgi:hypothetical protein